MLADGVGAWAANEHRRAPDPTVSAAREPSGQVGPTMFACCRRPLLLLARVIIMASPHTAVLYPPSEDETLLLYVYHQIDSVANGWGVGLLADRSVSPGDACGFQCNGAAVARTSWPMFRYDLSRLVMLVTFCTAPFHPASDSRSTHLYPPASVSRVAATTRM